MSQHHPLTKPWRCVSPPQGRGSGALGTIARSGVGPVLAQRLPSAPELRSHAGPPSPKTRVQVLVEQSSQLSRPITGSQGLQPLLCIDCLWTSDAEVAEAKYRAFASVKGKAIVARLIVRRVRKPGRPRKCADALHVDDTGSRSPRLGIRSALSFAAARPVTT
jgi:hypothetical protein